MARQNMHIRANIIFGYWVGRIAELAMEWLSDKRVKIVRPRNMVIALVCIAAFASAIVGAAESPEPPAPTAAQPYASGIETVVPRVSEAIGQALDKLANGSLKGMGDAITAFFLIALMVWTSVKTMAAGKGFGELIGEWVPIWISFAFVYTFLDKSAAKSIEAFMDSVGTALGGGSMASLSSALQVIAQPVFSAITTVTQMESSAIVDGWSPSTYLPAGVSLLGGIVAKLLTVLFLVIAAVVGMGTVVMSFVSLSLVLALAPIMVPFFMFKPLSWIFDSWLRFFLGACMMKIVLAFVLTAAGALLAALSTVNAQMVAEAAQATATEKMAVDLLMHAVMMILSLLASLLLLQVPSIATGLLSGSAGSTGFNGIRGLTQAPTGRIAASTASKPLGAMGGALGSGIAGGASAWRGARHAKAGKDRDMAYRTGAQKAGYDRGYSRVANARTRAQSEEKKRATDVAI